MSKPKRDFGNMIKRFLEPVKDDNKLWFTAIIQYALFAIGPIIGILFLRIATKYIETGNKQGLSTAIITFCVVMIAYYGLRLILRNIGRASLYAKGVKTIYKKYLPRFVALDNTEIEKIGTGRMISIIQEGMRRWTRLVEMFLRKGLELVTSLGFTLYVLYSTSSNLLIIFVIILIIIHIIVYRLNVYILKNKRLCNPIKNEYSRGLIRVLMSKFEILQQDSIVKEVNKLDTIRNNLYKTTKGRTMMIEGVYLIPNGLVAAMYIALFAILGYGIINGTHTFSEFVLFSSTIALLDWTLDSSSTSIKNFFNEFSQVEQLRNYFDNINIIHNNDGEDMILGKGSIKVDNLSFSYDTEGKSRILSNLSLNLPGGSKTALVGPSGGGKSTIIKLIAGYLRPDNGSVLVDDQDLTEVSLKSYYQHIGYLTQEPSVFDGTVWENLTYAMDTQNSPSSADASVSPSMRGTKGEPILGEDNDIMEKVKQAISDAQCDFVWDLPDGLETEIGERGVRLSGGQRQRLAIAKIFLKDPAIVLLDEPTSALDSESEEKVTIAMNRLFEGRTVIVIAHRLQTVKHADRILYIEDGMVVEEGTHKELMKEKGKYYRMVELQSGF